MRTPAYYEKLAELLSMPDIQVVSALSDDDFQTMRMICTEQRRRATAQGLPPRETLPLNVICDHFPAFDRWGAAVARWQAGVGDADLLIDGKRKRGFAYMPDWPEHRRRFLLTHADQNAEIPGWARTSGQGWILYEDTRPGQDHAARSERAKREFLMG